MCALCSAVSESLPTDTTDYSPPGSSVREISQARTLEWGAISFSRASSPPRDRTVSCPGRWILYQCATWKALSSSYVNSKLLLMRFIILLTFASFFQLQSNGNGTGKEKYFPFSSFKVGSITQLNRQICSCSYFLYLHSYVWVISCRPCQLSLQ